MDTTAILIPTDAIVEAFAGRDGDRTEYMTYEETVDHLAEILGGVPADPAEALAAVMMAYPPTVSRWG